MNSLYKKKILIIRNNEHFFETLRQSLSNYPYDISVVSKGNDGFEIAKKDRPDIILASTQLQDIDGIDLCWMIRQTPEICKMPYFLITEKINPEEKINAYRSGVDAILDNKSSLREIYTRIEATTKRISQLNGTNNFNPNKSLQGKLPHFTVIEILQMLNISKKSGTLIFTTDNDKGEIGFWEGKLVWAKQEKLIGEEAVKKITCWDQGYFVFENDLIHPIVNIHTSSMQLLLDCCKSLDEQNDQL